ncbi:hypothetical protein TRFO_26463 [Tritrichomonas foetus]|uniref:Uncharacterized protein n=1 Tax=Tritrichomonas foetus TaxID=1144522 RepID=A0A1J4K4K1_9EUKA|nr:hypothetical protein TRFO_26463 [Tritrichomonas foetus]|eukprot:OHT05776.1 hypothetical protein TRFO_26463 [Tritrichomonas foetus]
MSNIVALFQSVLNSLIHSIEPSIETVFHKVESKLSNTKMTDNELDHFLETLLFSYPRKCKSYQQMIETLVSFASMNPPEIMRFLYSMFKKESNRTVEKPPTIYAITSLSYKSANFYHFQFNRYVNLIVLTDLIFKIIDEYPKNQPYKKLALCGFNLCISSKRFHMIQDMLIETWSLIFYRISCFSIDIISKSYDQYLIGTNADRIFTLLSRVKGNEALADSLLVQIHQAKKKKWISSNILSSIANILSRIKCSPIKLNEFYKFAHEEKSSDLKEGAFNLITVLFNRLPQYSKKVSSFYSHRIYKRVTKEAKIRRCLKAFINLMNGDISNHDEIGDGTDPLDYISLTGLKMTNQHDPSSYTSIFMRLFFPNASFKSCKLLFRDILVHLAALDITEFQKSVLPHFIDLNADDPRFEVMMMSILCLNRDKFIKHSFCHATKEQIQEINSIVCKSITNLLPFMQNVYKENDKFIGSFYFQYQSLIDDANHIVNNFFVQNNCKSHFKPKTEQVVSNMIKGSRIDSVILLLECIHTVFKPKHISENLDLLRVILEMSSLNNQSVIGLVGDICASLLKKSEIRPIIIHETLQLILSSKPAEVCQALLQILIDALTSLSISISNELIIEIETIVFLCFLSASVKCRVLAMQIFKYIGSLGKSENYTLLIENEDSIISNVNLTLLILSIPEKPSTVTPIIGGVDYEVACCCHYEKLWLIYLSEIMNIFINHKCTSLLKEIHEGIQIILKSQQNNISKNNYTMSAVFLVYLDSMVANLDFDNETPKKKCKCKEASRFFRNILKSKNSSQKKALITTLSFLNWRVLPSVLPHLLKSSQRLYTNISYSLSLIIQKPENFENVISRIFDTFMSMLDLFQSYFRINRINGTRKIKWSNENLKILKKNEPMCVNYCILISAAFNNIQDQFPLDELPISYRQVLVQFLVQWTQLPLKKKKFNRLRSYSLNALIPILNAGTVFTNGYQFDPSLIDMLVQCQMSGLVVLDSLLFFHVDILLNFFIKNAFLRPKRESQLFLMAIINTVDKITDISYIIKSAGALVFLAIHNYHEGNDCWKSILDQVLNVAIDRGSKVDTLKMIDSASDIKFVPDVFHSVTEQLIDFALDLIKATDKVFIVRYIVKYLLPWFSKVRLLPTHKYILLNIPSKFRMYTVTSFIEELISISKKMSEEQRNSFAQLWYELIRTTDNHVVVLLCISMSRSNRVKLKLFDELLEKSPRMISKYLAKRCSFAFWYYYKSQMKKDILSQKWIVKILTHAFLEYVEDAAPNFTLAFHFSLLFIENSQELFEALTSLFGLEIFDVEYVWISDSENEGMSRVGDIVTFFVSQLKEEENHKALDKWSNEALKWAVACKDLKIAYRSLVIYNFLVTNLPRSFPRLINESVLYHMNQVNEDNCEQVGLFVSEVFKALLKEIDEPDFANYAFNFASSFLGFHLFDKNCMENAMPIFLSCLSNSILESKASDVIVEAFIPFVCSLETNRKSQEMFKEVIERFPSPELYLIAAVFYAKPLPFIKIGKTYKEIMEMRFSTEQVNRSFILMNAMIKTASRPLSNSIYKIANILVIRYKVKTNYLLPMYNAALQSLSVNPYAVKFVKSLAVSDPSIALIRKGNITNYGENLNNDLSDDSEYDGNLNNAPTNNLNHSNLNNNNANNNYSSLNNNDSSNMSAIDFFDNISIDKVKKSLTELFVDSPEILPINNCKNVDCLGGMISMEKPPKIIPYATQYEIIQGLKKESELENHNLGKIAQWSSTFSIGMSGITPIKSVIMSLNAANISKFPTQMKPLQKKKVKKVLLELPTLNHPNRNSFIIPFSHFMKLEKI